MEEDCWPEHIRAVLKELGFVRTHNLEFHDGNKAGLSFVTNFKFGDAPMNSKRSVYIFVWMPGGMKRNAEVLYVGKAGHGIRARLRQHIGGWGHNKMRRDRAKSKLADHGKVSVFTKNSEKCIRFGEEISTYSIDEEALISKLKPCWNVVGNENR